MINYLLRLYPNSYGFKFVPNLLTKNVRKVYVNTDVAKQVGLTDSEIHNLQQRIDKWKSDEDLRELRRKMKELEAEILSVKQNRGKGRPSKEFTNKVDLLNAYNNQVGDLRKGKKGRDSTLDASGNVKDFQIKSIGDRERRSIEGLFEINPEYNGIQQKLVGKSVLVFDDNISSGATLDDICLTLQRIGVKKVIPVTLAIIPKTIYGAHERLS
jgi:phosphoribosylpyrophosphate synthetase